jgi:hypothetical protein
MKARVASAGSEHWHYTQLEKPILDDVRAGRSAILFDLSNEGPAYDKLVFEELYRWIATNSLPPQSCIWLAQNRAIEHHAYAHAGDNAKLVRFENYDYFVKLIAWAFSPACPRSIPGKDWEAFATRLGDVSAKTNTLLCLNATPRLPRVLTVAALHHHGLLAEAIVSFPGMQYVKQGASAAEVDTFVDSHPALHYLRPALGYVKQMQPIHADAFEDKGNALVMKVDPSPYERTCLSLVTESDFSDGRIERITEKLAKAFCMGHPAFLVGNPRSVRFMSAFGFQDWSDVLSRRTEMQLDPALRFNSVFDEVITQISRINSDRAQWLLTTREVSEYNVRHAVSGRFLSTYVDSIEGGVVDRLARSINGSLTLTK